jgi:hypothetical protein
MRGARTLLPNTSSCSVLLPWTPSCTARQHQPGHCVPFAGPRAVPPTHSPCMDGLRKFIASSLIDVGETDPIACAQRHRTPDQIRSDQSRAASTKARRMLRRGEATAARVYTVNVHHVVYARARREACHAMLPGETRVGCGQNDTGARRRGPAHGSSRAELPESFAVALRPLVAAVVQHSVEFLLLSVAPARTELLNLLEGLQSQLVAPESGYRVLALERDRCECSRWRLGSSVQAPALLERRSPKWEPPLAIGGVDDSVD